MNRQHVIKLSHTCGMFLTHLIDRHINPLIILFIIYQSCTYKQRLSEERTHTDLLCNYPVIYASNFTVF